MNTTLTAIPGLLVGHATDKQSRTGCTAILLPDGFTPGISVPGFAPGSRETELMRPQSPIEALHGILLAGGSAFGLAAADGVVQFLRERGCGRATRFASVPLVAGAVIYDLDTNANPGFLPDASMGYAAAMAAASTPVEQGRVGAGTGASCGRLFRILPGGCVAASGLGTCVEERNGIMVGALVVVNALGNVHDPDTGEWLAGGVDASGRPYGREDMLTALSGEVPSNNTVLAVVATNVPLDKTQASRLAHMAGAGMARSVRPAHLSQDGDMVFALASRRPLPASFSWTENLLGEMAARAVARATVACVTEVSAR